MKKYLYYSFFAGGIAISLFGFRVNAEAANRPTLGINYVNGDTVEVRVIAEPSSPIQLSFFKAGVTTSTARINLGTTDTSGNLNLIIHGGSYGIPGGSTVAALANGLESPARLWPEYGANTFVTLSPSNVQVVLGQNVTVTASGPIYITNNTNSGTISATTTNNQIIVTGLTTGSGELTICQSATVCSTLPVQVLSAGASTSTITLSRTNLILHNGETTSLTISGGGGSYVVSNPTGDNTSWFETTLSGNSLTFQGKSNFGSGTVTVCSTTDRNNCATVALTGAAALSSSPVNLSSNSITLRPGQTQTITASGGTGMYYVYSNSNNSVINASITNSIATLSATSAGTSTIVICEQNNPNNCATALVTTDTSPIEYPNDSGLFFTVPLFTGQTFPFSAPGNSSSSLFLETNSNSSVAPASISGNTLTIKGQTTGQSDVRFCSGVLMACGIISVRVQDMPQKPYTFPTVGGLQAAANNRRAVVTWNTPHDLSQYDGYIIYRSSASGVRGTEIARMSKSQTSFTDTTTRNGERYYYTLVYYWGGLISNADQQVSLQL
jgi:hypothetical protein